MKTALIYDWFMEGKGGGEKTFEAIYPLFPSPIFSLFKNPLALRDTLFEKETIHTSFLQKFPKIYKQYRNYFPLYPLAIEQFDLSSYDLILSCSHCAAKGVLTHADQVHLSYCYTPVRYAWDLYHQYLKEGNLERGIKGKLARLFLHYFRLWDFHTSQRVDAFAAISKYVARRIQKTYDRSATVIYPPVDTHFFQMEEKKENFYLTASRFVPYKRIDLIVEAFAQMPDKKLVVIGNGPDQDKVKAKAKGNIELLGHQPDAVLKSYLQKAKAFVFAAIEDFGIVPIEAQACGTPVIAFGKGAILETIVDQKTGLFFQEQLAESIQEAVTRFEKREWDPHAIRTHAESFSVDRFQREIKTWVHEQYARIHEEKKACM